MKSTSNIFVGFGSNLGDVFLHYQKAKAALQNHAQIFNLRCSNLYATEAHVPFNSSVLGQNTTIECNEKYLNAVFVFATTLTLLELFAFLQDTEKTLGRLTGKGQWQPRTADLDVLFYDDVIYQDENLNVPHPRLHERKFVLAPLCDVAPDFVHPEFGLSVKKLLDICDDTHSVGPWL